MISSGAVAFNIAGAAEATGTKEFAIHDAIQARTLAAIRIDGQILISRKALVKWIDGADPWH